MTENQSRQMTLEECQEAFLQQIKLMCFYWSRVENSPPEEKMTVRERLNGLAHSILVILDGESPLPAFSVVPLFPVAEIPYYLEKGENWWPPLEAEGDECDIAGDLHNLFYKDERAINEQRRVRGEIK